MADQTSARGLRATLHSAFSYVRATEANQATSALTLDHLISAQVQRLKRGEVRAVLDGRGEAQSARMSRYDRLEKLSQDLADVVRAVEVAGEDPELLAALGVYEASEDQETEE